MRRLLTATALTVSLFALPAALAVPAAADTQKDTVTAEQFFSSTQKASNSFAKANRNTPLLATTTITDGRGATTTITEYLDPSGQISRSVSNSANEQTQLTVCRAPFAGNRACYTQGTSGKWAASTEPLGDYYGKPATTPLQSVLGAVYTQQTTAIAVPASTGLGKAKFTHKHTGTGSSSGHEYTATLTKRDRSTVTATTTVTPANYTATLAGVPSVTVAGISYPSASSKLVVRPTKAREITFPKIAESTAPLTGKDARTRQVVAANLDTFYKAFTSYTEQNDRFPTLAQAQEFGMFLSPQVTIQVAYYDKKWKPITATSKTAPAHVVTCGYAKGWDKAVVTENGTLQVPYAVSPQCSTPIQSLTGDVVWNPKDALGTVSTATATLGS